MDNEWASFEQSINSIENSQAFFIAKILKIIQQPLNSSDLPDIDIICSQNKVVQLS